MQMKMVVVVLVVCLNFLHSRETPMACVKSEIDIIFDDRCFFLVNVANLMLL